ncbi:MAG: thioredoxin domain-containing protein [Phycisphaerae bacterium]
MLKALGIAALASASLAFIACAEERHNRVKEEISMNAKPAVHRWTNRLKSATSPYLLQHQHNPVDWYEWGPEAIERARRENKPIFLSIGYAACHWCHVMAHESFEDADIAAVMNELFVNIKVDREERPDLDDIYMQATMILNQGQGGWPMSVWLTPDLKPFYAGTYFPPTSRWGRPGFIDICQRIADVWREKRDAILADAETLTGYVADSLRPTAEGTIDLSPALLDRLADALAGAMDSQLGGMLSGNTNKFPPSMALDLMLRRAVAAAHSPETGRAAEAAKLMSRVNVTLDNMARGGIYDHLAGGICRYSTDPRWLVPHFEKMLYDQALVSRIYVDAGQQTREPQYERTARGIFDYVLADLTSPAGGFYSSRDADSEGEEGRYYVWTRAQVLDALGEADGKLFCDVYDVTDRGNWDDQHAPGVAKNVLNLPRSMADAAKALMVPLETLEARMADARAKLLAARGKRVPPGLDDKVLVEWNGLMISSLARGGSVFGEPRYVQAAARAADALFNQQWIDERLHRAWRDGRTLPTAFLTDYAALIEACIELYEATFERRWMDRAIQLADRADELFWDDAGGGYFFTASDHEKLITRAKDLRDSATPSGNSLMLMNLLRLAAFSGDPAPRQRAERMMQVFGAELVGRAGASERFMQGVDFALAGPVEIAIVGPLDSPATQSLLRIAHAVYLPNRILAHLDPARPGDRIASPLLADRKMIGGKPTAYVCQDYACNLPVATAEELRRQLELTGDPTKQ